MINFLAELSKRRKVPVHPVPLDCVHRIYIIDISQPPEQSYWTAWGGHYDNFTGTSIELYFRKFLRHVETLSELRNTAVDYSLFIDTAAFMVYIKIPAHPWLYPDYGTQVEDVVPFLAFALNPDKPSGNIIRNVKAETRLSPPSLTVKLSEGLSGVSLNQGFSLSFENSDGRFDRDSEWDLFNTPARLLKTFAVNPEYADFKLIRDGLVSGAATTFNTFNVDVSDKLRAMTNPVCEALGGERYGNAPISEKARGKNIPVVYGTKKVSLINVDGEDSYLAAEYASAVHSVADKDGTELPFVFNPGANIITFDYSAVYKVFDRNNQEIPIIGRGSCGVSVAPGTAVDYIAKNAAGDRIPHRYDSAEGVIRYAEAAMALVTGYTQNTIGEVIVDLAARKGMYWYISSIWNLNETDWYMENSPRINIVFDGGDVNSAIQKALKSDMAYFIQQSDGKFTIRKWGRPYAAHDLLPWIITQAPQKSFGAAVERYFSSCVILFESGDGETKSRYLFDEMERQAELIYRKLKETEFETDLAGAADAAELARALGGRYAKMRHTITLPVGVDTAGIELLDTVTVRLNINGREISESQNYIATGIDPAQDILTLEEAGDGQ